MNPTRTSTRRIARPSRAGNSQVKPGSPAKTIAQVVLLTAITFAPWYFGCIETQAQVWLFGATMLSLVACWVAMATDRQTSSVPTAIAPLCLAVIFGLLQLVPLGRSIHSVVSPTGAELWRAMVPPQQIDAMPSADQSLAKSLTVETGANAFPISLYPQSTMQDLGLLLLATAVFVLGMRLFRSEQASFALLWVLGINGALLAAFGLVQQLSWNGMIYWRLPVSGSAFASFINRNNAAGFLNLCLAGAVGLLVYVLLTRNAHPKLANDAIDPLSLQERMQAGWRQFMLFVADLNAARLTVIAAVACISLGIICSLSRGGWLAMGGATVVLLIAMGRVRKTRVRWPVLAAGAVTMLALVAFIGKGEVVWGRFATMLNHEQSTSNQRLAHWQDGLAASADYWRTGSGLGTYRHVYKLYEEDQSQEWFYHAENQYLEAFLEGGAIGLGLMLTLIGLVAVASIRLLNVDGEPKTIALGVAGLFALAAQAIHGFFDFGLYIPSNMILFALLCGAVTGRAAYLDSVSAQPQTRRTPKRWGRLITLPSVRSLPASLVTLLIMGVGVGAVHAHWLAARDRGRDVYVFADRPDGAERETLRQSIATYSSAIGEMPDVQAQSHLAKLRIHLYRVDSFEELRATGGVDANALGLWRSTQPAQLHGWAHSMARESRFSELGALQDNALITGNIQPAIQNLVRARRASPLFPDVHLALAELSFATGAPESDQTHLRRARSVGSTNSRVLMHCGMLDYQAGRRDDALKSWRRCIDLEPQAMSTIANILGDTLREGNTIAALLPNSPRALVFAAQNYLDGEDQRALQGETLDRAQALLQLPRFPEDERYYLLATISRIRRANSNAIPLYLKAIALRPGAAKWRYELAQLLHAEGMHMEAQEQLEACVRMEPENETYGTLLQQYSTAS